MTSGFNGSPALNSSRNFTFRVLQRQLNRAANRRRRAEARHFTAHQLAQQLSCIEARRLHRDDGRFRIPGRKKRAPGVLRPTRAAQVQVHIAGLQPEPVHRGQMPDRIADVRVLHEFRLRRRPRREVQQQRVGCVVGPSGADSVGARSASALATSNRAPSVRQQPHVRAIEPARIDRRKLPR